MSRGTTLFRNTLLISIAKITVQAGAFLLIPVYTRVLSPEGFGLLELVLTYSALLAPVLLLQVDAAVFRLLLDVRGDEMRVSQLVSTVWIVGFCGIAFVIAVTFVISVISQRPVVLLAGCVFASAMLLALGQQTVRGLGKISVYVVSSVISGALVVVGNIFVLLVLHGGPNEVLIATSLGYTCGAFGAFLGTRCWRLFRIRQISGRDFRKVLRYSVPLMPNGAAWWAIDAGGRAIVAAFLGLAAIGTYGIASRISQVFAQAFSYFNLAWVETASLAVTDHDREPYFSRVFNAVLTLSCGVIIIFIASIPVYFPILGSDEFAPARALIPILFLSSLLNAWVTLYSSIYIALQNTRAILVTTLLAGLIATGLSMLLVHPFGALGVAASSSVAWAVALVHRHVALRRIFKVGYSFETILAVGVTVLSAIGASALETSGTSWNPYFWTGLACIVAIVLNFKIAAALSLMIKKRMLAK